ncbi:MAG TPA: ParB/RepB/Spo0J family partition protein [Gammaproteobacteria bacterium]|nr:ParB/RepB/Spo0J family partition protein [Gammaproteobacteria bacterium]
MATRKRGLGKGLDALLGTTATVLPEYDGAEKLRSLPVDLVRQGQHQPRKSMNAEALKDLADSIRTQGVVQPILVRPLAGSSDQYEIVAGERRWRAAQMAGLHEVPAVIREITDQTAVCIGLIENIQREDLNPLEEARTLSRLQHEFSMTHEAIAEAVGRSRSSVTNLLRLLDLHPDVQALLQNGSLEMGHARALAGLSLALQTQVARQIVNKGMSVRDAERLAREAQSPGRKKKRGKEARLDPNIRRLQDDLSERLGANVVIKHSAAGKGSLVIHYNSSDELDGILKRIK